MDKKTKHVLVVEDSAVQAATIEEMLREEGLEVLYAENGGAGVSMAQQYLPDAIVLDIKMPDMDGFEVCRRLKDDERTANIPILMLTVCDTPDALVQGLDLGAIDFIPKDAFCYTVLRETLRQLRISDNPPSLEEGDASC